ncbi:MAG: restriction endonuclease subunit S [Gemmatimonadetes bacterium]|nr:restriction endonuclease subunit S [Gemmatimonadota bacterium]
MSATGLTRVGLGQYELDNALIPVPPHDEQEAIADFLNHETAKMDALVAEQRRLMALLKEKRQAVISHAVTKGLSPDVPMKPSGVTWLGDVPAHWRPTRLRALFRQVKRQGYPSEPVLSVYRDYGVILKSSRDDNNNKTPVDLDSYQLVEPGDLVINKMKAWQGSLGIATHRGITSPDYATFSPLHVEMEGFLHLLLRCKVVVSAYRGLSTGIREAQWRIEPGAFLGLQVFLPPVHEQRAILEATGEKIARYEALTTAAEESIAILQERRVALISAAVTGQIDVRRLAAAEAA